MLTSDFSTSPLSSATSGVLTMTSLQIAEVTGKQHGHVIRDLKDLEEKGVLGLSNFGETSKDSQNKARIIYRLPKRETLILTSGYSAVQRAAIIDRWLELEEQQKPTQPLPPALPAQVAKVTIDAMMGIAEAYGVPKSYAMQIAATTATKESGQPWDKLLTQAECMNNVPAEDVMLEPTELGKLFELSAIAMNKKLAELGLQVRQAGSWVPTEQGGALCQRHGWSSGNKAGYNLKWKAVEIERMLAD